MSNNYVMDDEADPRVRTTEKNGRTYIVTQKDPYGFCYITWDSDEALPKEFEGAFTSFNTAFHEVEVYANKIKTAPKRKVLEAKLS